MPTCRSDLELVALDRGDDELCKRALQRNAGGKHLNVVFDAGARKLLLSG